MKRAYIIWFGVLGASVIAAIVFVNAFLGMEDSSMFVEIIGAFIGLLLAISFAEVAKLDDKNDPEKRLISSFLDEIRAVIELIKKDSMWLPSDMWDMGIGSGDLCLLDTIARRDFSEIFSYVKAYRTLAENLKAARMSQDDALMIKTADKIRNTQKLIIRKGEELIVHYS